MRDSKAVDYIDKFSLDHYENLKEQYNKLVTNKKRSDDRLQHILKVSDKQGFHLLKVKEELAEYKNELEDKVKEKTYEITQLLSSFDKYVIASKTDTQGIITYVSKAFCNLSGYSEDDLLGEPHNKVRHPNMSSDVFKDMWETIKSGKQWQGEVRNLKKDGGDYWVDAVVTPEYDTYGKLLGYSSIRQDISDKKKVEELSQSLEKLVVERTNELNETNKKLKELNDDLENQVLEGVAKNIKKERLLIEQSKMANMGAMIGNITHQWRQPLSSISTIASGIQIKQDYDMLSLDQVSNDMDTIIDNVDYLSENINIFRDFLREKKEKKEVLLEDRIDVAIKIVSLALKDNGINLINNINYSDKTKITMVVGELTEVIINIINNAKDILLATEISDPWIKLELEKFKDHVVITIEDNGGGIDDEIMPKIYEEYFTTKDEDNGTGLGLHMSYKIITESLNGKIYCKNSKYGAKFFIELPLSE